MLDVVVFRLESGMWTSREPCGEASRTLGTVKVVLNMCIHTDGMGKAFVVGIFGGKRILTCWH